MPHSACNTNENESDDFVFDKFFHHTTVIYYDEKAINICKKIKDRQKSVLCERSHKFKTF